MYDSEKLARNFITNFLVALETTSHPPISKYTFKYTYCQSVELGANSFKVPLV